MDEKQRQKNARVRGENDISVLAARNSRKEKEITRNGW